MAKSLTPAHRQAISDGLKKYHKNKKGAKSSPEDDMKAWRRRQQRATARRALERNK